jgi:hypothetical protein
LERARKERETAKKSERGKRDEKRTLAGKRHGGGGETMVKHGRRRQNKN